MAVFVFMAGIEAAKETVYPLLGQPPEESFVRQLKELVMEDEHIIGIHDLIVHNYGPGRVMISLHAEVPADEDILKIHDMIDIIENDLKEQLHCEAVIHMDPLVVNDEQTNELRAAVKDIVENLEGDVSMHDFRTVIGPTHTNMIFDVLVPFDYPLTDAQVKEKVQESVWEQIGKEYYTVIQIDRPYTVMKK